MTQMNADKAPMTAMFDEPRPGAPTRLADLQRRHIFTSLRTDWRTPRALFQALDAEFHFVLDVCATKANACCAEFLSLPADALSMPWHGPCWLNPPYGRALPRWLGKAARECALGVTTVALLPARTDTAWFHDHCLGREIRFLRGRLTFDDNPKLRATFPSMLVIFRQANSQTPLEKF